MRTRHLEWDGCVNVRDLGGLPAAGGTTRRGVLVRADSLEKLTAAGWSAAEAHGIRTVVDLRNDDEVKGDAAPRPASVTTLRLPLDGWEDREFWDVWASGPQFGTPLYYGPHLDRFPERSAEVIRAIAHAPPGGVAFHCVGGRDRTGQIAMLVLALAGVPAGEIAADYALSGPDPDYLAERGTTAARLIEEILATLDVQRRLALGDDDVAALRARLVESAA